MQSGHCVQILQLDFLVDPFVQKLQTKVNNSDCFRDFNTYESLDGEHDEDGVPDEDEVTHDHHDVARQPT